MLVTLRCKISSSTVLIQHILSPTFVTNIDVATIDDQDCETIFTVITYCSVTCHQNSVTNIRKILLNSITVGVSTRFWTGSNYLLIYFEHWSTRSRTNARCNILDMFIEVNGPTRIIQFVTPGCRRRRFVGYFRPTEKSWKFHHIFQNQTFWTMTWFCDS